MEDKRSDRLEDHTLSGLPLSFIKKYNIMRIWTLHPSLLDYKGLVACWRETLLAQKVLQNKTKGYKNHPQLIRFKQQKIPTLSVATYLKQLWMESIERKYKFDSRKFDTLNDSSIEKIPVTYGQVMYEFEHLQNKLYERDSKKYFDNMFSRQKHNGILVNPIFDVYLDGGIEPWEKI